MGREELMGYAIVVVLAAAIGLVVYVYTVHLERERDLTKGWAAPRTGRADAGAGSPPPPGTAYVPVSVARRTWQTRLVGFLALVALMIASAAVLAYSLVRAGTVLFRMLAHKITSG